MESDLFVTILTESGHRRELLAKGAAGRSKRKSHMELMNLVSGTFYQGKTHQYLQDISCKKSFHRLKANLERILRMHMILEIIERTVLEEDPHPEIYQLLADTLETMNQTQAHELTPDVTLIKLANFLGFLPNFKECCSCHMAITEDTAVWDENRGVLQCPKCANTNLEIEEEELISTQQHFPLKYRKVLEFFRQSPHRDLEKIQIQAEEQKALQQFLPKIFLNHLGKPLKSLNTIY